MAAVLACGAHAVLSHRSAAALWGLYPTPRTVDITVTRGQRRHRDDIVVHRSPLSATEVEIHERIPCTTPARTLVDLAAVVSRRRLERAIDLTEELHLFDLTATRSQLEQMPGSRGASALSAVLASFDGRDATRSAAEQRFLTLVRRQRLPSPEINVWMPLPEGGGYRPDFLWRDRQLIVEIDGRPHHSRRAAFEHDRRRDRRLARLGYETRRYAAREILATPDAVMSELAFFLADASRRGRA